jgi:iron complex transport system permease protein
MTTGDMGNTRGGRQRWFVTFTAVVSIALVVVSLLCGARSYTVSEILTDPEAFAIVRDLRGPRVLFALTVGGGLALVGVMYQALFRNPLASPFTLGVSSGAALGAAFALTFGAGVLSAHVGALGGAALTIALILALSRRMVGSAGESLLLLGVVFSFLCSSIITLAQYVSDYAQLFRVTRWMMGGIPTVTYGDLAPGVAALALLCAWVAKRNRDLDLMLFGDDVAALKGVETTRLYYAAFALSSLFVGWVVAMCGVIGFVGIIVPAIARHFVGCRHRALAPLSLAFGGMLVLGCDLLGRVINPPFEIPAGVFTAVIGGPLFLLLVVVGRGRRLRL